MPKLKTNKAAKRRFKITATGKVLHSRAGRRHLLTDRSSSYKRKRRRWQTAGEIETREAKALLPYR